MGSFRSVRSSVGQGSFGSPFSIKGFNHGLNRFDRNLRCWLDSFFVKKLLFALLLTISGQSIAVVTFIASNNDVYSSATQACIASIPSSETFSSTSMYSSSLWNCYATQNSTGKVRLWVRVATSGTCESGETQNSTTGVCEGPPVPICTAGKEYVYTRYEGTVKNGVYSESPTSVKVAGSCVVTRAC